MPIYEYKCKKCGKEYEIFQRITASDRTSCKFCKGPAQKLISRTTFHLKGSGWYATDYGGKKAPAVETTSAAESSAASTSDSTPDTSDKMPDATAKSGDLKNA
ncbi:MAG: zinc ribbon domain-containing protein [Syntrophales bacterium]|nr:zinc ribbon domain-containing protein [Syntrophales bacterium]